MTSLLALETSLKKSTRIMRSGDIQVRTWQLMKLCTPTEVK